jgi:CBS-domain-containing membrane protein
MFKLSVSPPPSHIHTPSAPLTLPVLFLLPDLGYLFAFFPALMGALIMVAIAVLFNNMEDVRSYPKAWRFPGTHSHFKRPMEIGCFTPDSLFLILSRVS